MKVLVTGASGFLGSEIVSQLTRGGHEVAALVRGPTASQSNFRWNPATGELEIGAINKWGGPLAVIHLAGENIAARRWTPDQKRKIHDSRVEATRRLCQSLLQLAHKPSVFISASAIGIYGDRGDEILVEESAAGEGFLPEVVHGWESASDSLESGGVRRVLFRLGMILGAEGGALGKMLPIFKLGLGGKVGPGRQWVSWISRADAARLFITAVEEPGWKGVYNAVTPGPARNRDFASKLGKALHRPAVFPAPGWMLRMLFGELADSMLLASQRVKPVRVLETGFAFEHPSLDQAFQYALGSPGA